MYGLALIYGFLAATAALLAQVVLLFFIGMSLTLTPSLMLLIGAATLEESFRLLFLIQLAKVHPRATTVLHALGYWLGFVIAELSLLALTPTDLPEPLLIVKMALVHLVGTLALYCGLRYRREYPLAPLAALLFALLFHTLYNASL